MLFFAHCNGVFTILLSTISCLSIVEKQRGKRRNGQVFHHPRAFAVAVREGKADDGLYPFLRGKCCRLVKVGEFAGGGGGCLSVYYVLLYKVVLNMFNREACRDRNG